MKISDTLVLPSENRQYFMKVKLSKSKAVDEKLALRKQSSVRCNKEH